ncbi:MAG: hypothetical protein HYZ57_17530 [Acidobacteria bacterium]|nr:hypothetical protein [Acidobacteriota bacterium]
MLERRDAALLTVGWSDDLCNYIGRSQNCRPLSFADLRRQVTPEMPLDKVLDGSGANIFFADATVGADPLARRFLSNASATGWKVIGMRRDGIYNWTLLEKPPGSHAGARGVAAGEELMADPVTEIADPNAGITLGGGWYPYEFYRGESFRWVNNDAEINLSIPKTGPISLYMNVQSGPGLNGKPLELQILADGKLLQTARAHGAATIRLILPKGRIKLRLHTQSENNAVPNDPRIMNFRVFKIWTR